jgi:class 3 adenylate cyclase
MRDWPSMSELPGGTLTFVFSDVEGSTRLLRQLGNRYGSVLAEHQRLLREAFAAHGGHEVDTQGDSFFASFSRARDGVLAALRAQRSVAEHGWPDGTELRIRLGLHTGPAEVADGRYVGLAVHRAARLCALGSGGQILLSHATVALLEDDEDELPGIELRDLGEHRLKDFDRAVRVYQLLAPDLEPGSPPLPTEANLPAVRASDADRERTVAALREHTAVGRLTLEEFSERTERATSATTLDELESIAVDLPPAVEAERPLRRARRVTAALFSDTERTGRWRLPRFSFAFVFMGNADLDLRQAELDGKEVSITAFMLFGNVDFYVPERVEVDFGGLAVLGHKREHGRDVPPQPGTPLVRARVFSLFGTVDLWRVPTSWATKTFGEIMRATKSGEHRELPP